MSSSGIIEGGSTRFITKLVTPLDFFITVFTIHIAIYYFTHERTWVQNQISVMPKRKPKRPWIRVYDRNGLCIQRCRDPEKAVLEFLHLYLWDGRRRKTFGIGNGERIKLDNVEYNPPIIKWQSSRFPIDSVNWERKRQEALVKLKLLIDIHVSFYYA